MKKTLTPFPAIILAVSSVPVGAAGVDAGTLVESAAEARFDIGATSQSVTSNTVSIRVDEILNLSLASLDPGAISASEGSAVLSYELTNTGNGPEAFRLTSNPAVAGNDFDMVVSAIFVDSNGNGNLDLGVDQQLAAGQSTAVLLPNSNLTIFLDVSIPANLADGAQSQVELIAEADTGSGAFGDLFPGQGEGGSDAIIGYNQTSAASQITVMLSQAMVELAKSASVRDPFGGSVPMATAIITYTIEARVSGSGSVSELNIADSIPQGTQYRPGTLALNDVLLTDEAGDDAGQADANGIVVALGEAQGGTNHSIQFEVTIQ